MATTPPGWYDDGRGALRWWDGAQWTEHVHVPDAAPAPAQVQPGYASYPGGHGYQQGGVLPPAAEKKSKLWILWVVLGVLVLGLVILAAVLIPLFIGLVTGSAGAGAAQQSAVATVKHYDHAWANADCDEYFGATTESFREFQGIEDCDTFVASSEQFTSTTSNYTLAVTSVTSEDGAITVHTRETFTDPLDEEGDDATPIENAYTYTLVSVDGAWLIDDATN